jgi:hypothetical protein
MSPLRIHTLYLSTLCNTIVNEAKTCEVGNDGDITHGALRIPYLTIHNEIYREYFNLHKSTYILNNDTV